MVINPDEQHAADDPARARRVELILQRVDRLPTLGEVARRALELGSDDEIDINELARLIESDPALTGRVLALCKRADLGVGSITTVDRAVKMLGIDAIRSAVLSVEIYGAMDMGSEPDGGFDRVGYWRHAIGTACGAEMIATRAALKGAPRDHAFVAGMLHGLGRLVLERVLPQGYSKVVSLARARGTDTARVEAELIGLDHHTAGKRVAEHWGLPHALQDVIWLHGHPTEAIPDVRSRDLIAVVRWARMLSRSLMVGWSGDFTPAPSLDDVADESGISAEILSQVAAELPDAVAERCEALGIESKTGAELMLESVQTANIRLSEINEKLEKRAMRAANQGRVLTAIRAFMDQDRRAASVADVLGDVSRSASSLFGRGTYAAIFQSRPEAPWEIHTFNSRGELKDSAVEEAPIDAGTADLAEVLELDTTWVAAWISAAIEGLPDPTRLQYLPLWSRSDREGSNRGTSAVLVTDRPIQFEIEPRDLLDSAAAAWGSAVRHAAQHEGARRVSEKLAESQRRLAEMTTELARRESMAHLDEFSAGCAHEMNNPLTVVKGEAQLLNQESPTPAVRARADKIVKASQELSDLVTALQLLASPPEPNPIRIGLVDLLRDAVKEARNRTPAALKVRIVPNDDVPLVTHDRVFLLETVIEVLRNAAESGSTEIAELAVHAWPVENRMEIRVKDAGRGMDAEVLRHACDPFYSKRSAGRGTGLGLTRARRYVELMDGTLQFESEVERGTVAILSLPISAAGTGSTALVSDEGVRDEAA